MNLLTQSPSDNSTGLLDKMRDINARSDIELFSINDIEKYQDGRSMTKHEENYFKLLITEVEDSLVLKDRIELTTKVPLTVSVDRDSSTDEKISSFINTIEDASFAHKAQLKIGIDIDVDKELLTLSVTDKAGEQVNFTSPMKKYEASVVSEDPYGGLHRSQYSVPVFQIRYEDEGSVLSSSKESSVKDSHIVNTIMDQLSTRYVLSESLEDDQLQVTFSSPNFPLTTVADHKGDHLKRLIQSDILKSPPLMSEINEFNASLSSGKLGDEHRPTIEQTIEPSP